MKFVIEVTPSAGAEAEEVGDAMFDLLASVGQNDAACEKFDALVYTVDGWEPV